MLMLRVLIKITTNILQAQLFISRNIQIFMLRSLIKITTQMPLQTKVHTNTDTHSTIYFKKHSGDLDVKLSHQNNHINTSSKQMLVIKDNKNSNEQLEQ